MKEELADTIAALAAERVCLLDRLPSYETGLRWCHELSDVCDRVVKAVYRHALQDEPNAPPVAILATGGYGRRELAPYSDVDISLVPLEDASPGLDALIRRIYQDLHHAFGTVFRIDVGWAFRLVADAPGLDPRTRTGLLDTRLLAGSPEVQRKLLEAFWQSFPVGDFLLAKVEERQEMWRKHHDTPLVVEPHLKEGAGGLRSFQAANWIGMAIGERASESTAAYDEVLRARNLLHLVCHRGQDLLTRSRQVDVAELIGISRNDLMESLYLSLLSLQRDFDQGLERLQETRFPLSPGVRALRGEARVTAGADPGEAAVGIAIATRLGLRVPESSSPSQGRVAGPAALYAVATGEPTIRNLDRCGLLSFLLPELKRCENLLPDDSIHTYTVYEHTLRVIRNLDSLQPGTFLGDLKAEVRHDSLLYLATLLHDVGKAEDSLHHSEVGATMAREVCARWNLGPGDTELVCWLVQEHLTLDRFLKIRDIQNPATINEFAGIVKDADRLHALTLLTWADVNAVAPGAWTPSQESFLRELHARTLEVLQGELPAAPDSGIYRQRLLRQLAREQIQDEDITGFVESMPAHYLSIATPELVRLHSRYVRQALSGPPIVEFNPLVELSATEVTVCAGDEPGLLSRILGVFYALDLSIESIRAFTTRGERQVALDVFTVSLGGKPVPSATCAQIAASMLAVLSGERSADSFLLDKGKDPTMQQRVFSYAYIEGNPGVLEIKASRGRGMAYRLSRFIAGRGWNIVAARVGQWAGSGAAAFYVLNHDDLPLAKSEVEQAMKESGQGS